MLGRRLTSERFEFHMNIFYDTNLSDKRNTFLCDDLGTDSTFHPTSSNNNQNISAQ